MAVDCLLGSVAVIRLLGERAISCCCCCCFDVTGDGEGDDEVGLRAVGAGRGEVTGFEVGGDSDCDGDGACVGRTGLVGGSDRTVVAVDEEERELALDRMRGGVGRDDVEVPLVEEFLAALAARGGTIEVDMIRRQD